eukprot:6923894-Pyramimonas_sp.AAC.1
MAPDAVVEKLQVFEASEYDETPMETTISHNDQHLHIKDSQPALADDEGAGDGDGALVPYTPH